MRTRHFVRTVISMLLLAGCCTEFSSTGGEQGAAETVGHTTEDLRPIAIGERVALGGMHRDMPPHYQIVDTAGCIVAPLVGKVAVAGLTLAEASAKIAQSYVARGYYTREVAFQLEVTRP